LLRALAEGSVPVPIHALSLELRWKGGFDLIVEFTFLRCFSGKMADEREDGMDVEEEGETHSEEHVDEDEDLLAHPEWKWIARESRKMASEITSTSLGVFTILEEDSAPGNFVVYNVGPTKRFARHSTGKDSVCTSLFSRSSG
jgi:hypothetical protein